MNNVYVKLACCLTIIACAGIFTSCSGISSGNETLEYFPFQSEENGNWGLISVDGEVLFADEFKECPTIPLNGRFNVKNGDGLWEMYTVNEKPQKVGGEYKQLGLFYEDVTPAVEKGKPITLINRDGEIVVTLDKINGKVVSECRNFEHGRAVVKVDGYYGAINTKGEIEIEPRYTVLESSSNGMFIGVDKKYENSKNQTISILDNSGNEVMSYKADKYKDIACVHTSLFHRDYVFDDMVALSVMKGSKESYGLMGLDGEWIMKPSSKIQQIYSKRGDNFIFGNSDGCGLMNIKGEVLIRAKFSVLSFLDDDVLVGMKDEHEVSLYDLNGDKISSASYEKLLYNNRGKYFAKVADNEWVVLDKTGKETQIKADVYNVDSQPADSNFEGDYTDLDGLVSSMKFEKDGMLGLNCSMTADDIFNTFYNSPSFISNSTATEAKEYISEKISAHFNANKVRGFVTVWTDGLINTNTENSGWWTSTSYYWSDNTIQAFDIIFSESENETIEGKTKELYDKIVNSLSKLGTTVEKGNNAIVVEMPNTYCYYACWTGDRVYICYGNLDKNKLDTSSFNDASADNIISYSQPTLGPLKIIRSTNNDLETNITDVDTARVE